MLPESNLVILAHTTPGTFAERYLRDPGAAVFQTAPTCPTTSENDAVHYALHARNREAFEETPRWLSH
jgi:hypothetical protein